MKKQFFKEKENNPAGNVTRKNFFDIFKWLLDLVCYVTMEISMKIRYFFEITYPTKYFF